METERDLQEKVALSCQILAQHGLVKASTGHVSCRVPGENYILVRGRPQVDKGLRFAQPESIIRVDLDGNPVGDTKGVRRVSEVFIHTEIYKRRPDVNSVIHAHPPGVVLCTVTDLHLKLISATHEPVVRRFFSQPGGIPTYDRTFTLHTVEEVLPMLDVMGKSDVCLLQAHGIAAAGKSIERATLLAIGLEGFARLNYWASLRGVPLHDIPDEDKTELDRRAKFERLEDFHPVGGEAPAGVESEGENAGWAYLTALLETGTPQFDNLAVGFRPM